MLREHAGEPLPNGDVMEVSLSEPRFAARLNAFEVSAERHRPEKPGRIATVDPIERAATVPGLSAVDRDGPDHLAGQSVSDLAARMPAAGVPC